MNHFLFRQMKKEEIPVYTDEIFAILAGNPAKVLRRRFDDELIDLLLEYKWWDKSTEQINALIPLLTSSDFEKVKLEIKKELGVNLSV